MDVTIGGDRLGAGQKEKVHLKHFNRSSFDRSYIWRSTMSQGTLVPFMSELMLPGSSGEVELNCEVMTLPTTGPLFGSFKVQLDVFSVPIRLFMKDLQYNKLKVGLNMQNVTIPQIKTINKGSEGNSTSSVLNYLGVGGNGYTEDEYSIRKFNAVPLLSYYSIYKNYYANLQEERGFVIHNELRTGVIKCTGNNINAGNGSEEGDRNYVFGNWNLEDNTYLMNVVTDADVGYEGPISFGVYLTYDTGGEFPVSRTYKVEELFKTVEWREVPLVGGWQITCQRASDLLKSFERVGIRVEIGTTVADYGSDITPKLKEFPLTEIDELEGLVLDRDFEGDIFYSANGGVGNELTNSLLGFTRDGESKIDNVSLSKNQEGLLIKTYQSDLLNNWVSTEWLDGAGGVAELSSVDTSSGSFTMDTLNLAEKVYNMLNRIAVSGGSYDDWLDAVYTHERVKEVHTPVYLGSLIKELAFQEVISTAGSENSNGERLELGELAGRGKLTGKHKGGRIKVKCDEPSYIMGLVSLTPRIDVSTSLKWDMDLKNYGQLHAPNLDGIGYQDLLTQTAHYLGSTASRNDEGNVTYSTIGKQPAWINYMTNINKTYGNFASGESQAFMVLNRNYSVKNGVIQDLTTYIDPVVTSQIFANPNLDSQNFWVQISNKFKVRQKMSSKQIPNL
jgi:hypothetical protein